MALAEWTTPVSLLAALRSTINNPYLTQALLILLLGGVGPTLPGLDLALLFVDLSLPLLSPLLPILPLSELLICRVLPLLVPALNFVKIRKG